MIISFLNVDQGDSIILQWREKGNNIVAIIDSNKENIDVNPTVEYLKKIEFDEVRFILMSHPHYDHYSGLADVLEYLESKNIRIYQLWLTAFQSLDYLLSAVKKACNSIIAEKELGSLFLKIRDLQKNKRITEIIFAYDRIQDIELEKGVNLRLLSPSTLEFEKFISNNNYNINEEGPHNNPKANLLSTVIQIFNLEKNWQIILTADQEGGTFSKILKKHSSALNKLLILGQASHHGSKYNLNQIFWGRLKKNASSPIIISVGENFYGHPSPETIKYYKNNKFELYTTNELWDYNSLVKVQVQENKITDLLNSFSSVVSKSSKSPKYNGNQHFEIAVDGTVTYLGN